MFNDDFYLTAISGFSDNYYVSPCGSIWSNRGEGIFLTGSPTSQGYLVVSLYDNGMVKRNCYVHCLVAQAYLANPEGLPQVNHKDRLTDYNHVDNLEWCTAQYRSEYINAKPFAIRDPRGLLHEGIYLARFCRDNNLNLVCVRKVLKGTQKGHKGWVKP